MDVVFIKLNMMKSEDEVISEEIVMNDDEEDGFAGNVGFWLTYVADTFVILLIQPKIEHICLLKFEATP